MSGGIKRDRDGSARTKPAQGNTPRGRFHSMFENFRDELDEHYDLKEKIATASRDITSQSKKIIFALHRVKHLNQEPPAIDRDIGAHLDKIHDSMRSIHPYLNPVSRYRYASSLRCLEEFVEAMSFMHYLRHQKLITFEEAQASIPLGVLITPHDYMFGVFDLFGEMMRFATVTTAQNGEMLRGNDGRTILADIQELGCSFELLRRSPTKEYGNKMHAARQSVQKVERLGYGLAVRGSERPKGWIPDMKDDMVETVSPI
ncbi:hypothetical protein QQS21_011478 [Conoideocrella luteorostrata]|uniref:Translin-associated protein X n=1 Tax=Conoideocrella luteorostrata TaxID=1105319 RepID=A0AAJ0CHL5_9HYPO|nr:hypothetical protein QQS21_011478 [Conoideocrella luteorostrata]